MRMTMVGNIFVEKSPTTGTFQIAYDVATPNGKTGTAVFHYEYDQYEHDKRDIMAESLMTTPEIADEMREFLAENNRRDLDSLSAHGYFSFPAKEHTNENPDKVRQALEAATVLVYDYN